MANLEDLGFKLDPNQKLSEDVNDTAREAQRIHSKTKNHFVNVPNLANPNLETLSRIESLIKSSAEKSEKVEKQAIELSEKSYKASRNSNIIALSALVITLFSFLYSQYSSYKSSIELESLLKSQSLLMQRQNELIESNQSTEQFIEEVLSAKKKN